MSNNLNLFKRPANTSWSGRVSEFIRAVLGAPRFFYAIVGLLLLQALWIALTARYPQAFDENYHFGLIQLHADKWLPYFSQHPPGAEIYGGVTRDPSYLYHYIMSLPYRALRLATDSLTVQIISLRLINIALFVWGLFLSRRLLLEIGASRRMMHTALFFFVITPIMPLLAGQISYDNAIFPLTILLLLLLVRLLRQLQVGGLLNMHTLMAFMLTGMTASIIKYTFTPVLLGATVILAVICLRAYLDRRKSGGLKLKFTPSAASFVLLAALLVAGVLFAERYGLNLLRYQTPVPDCAKVLTIEQCKQYSPWGRDHLFQDLYPKPTTWGIAVYPGVWVHRTVFETMFTITSHFYPGSQVVKYWPAAPLTIANYTAWFIVIAGTALSALYARRLWQMSYLRLLLLIIAFYLLVLFAKNFAMYLHTGEAVAIHGRYLIPVYPVLYLMLALAFSWFFDRLGRPQLKSWLVVIVSVLFIHGGGLSVWLMRSDHHWYWPHIRAAQQANWWAKNSLDYVIIQDIDWWKGKLYPESRPRYLDK